MTRNPLFTESPGKLYNVAKGILSFNFWMAELCLAYHFTESDPISHYAS